MAQNRLEVKVNLPGRDELNWSVEEGVDGKSTFQFRVVACPELSNLLRLLRRESGDDIRGWNLPHGKSHSEILVREFVLKAQGKFKLPYEHEELCHCRRISTQDVDAAIVCGAHSLESVRHQTTANTACGTCAPDVQKLIDYRLQEPSK